MRIDPPEQALRKRTCAETGRKIHGLPDGRSRLSCEGRQTDRRQAGGLTMDLFNPSVEALHERPKIESCAIGGLGNGDCWRLFRKRRAGQPLCLPQSARLRHRMRREKLLILRVLQLGRRRFGAALRILGQSPYGEKIWSGTPRTPSFHPQTGKHLGAGALSVSRGGSGGVGTSGSTARGGFGSSGHAFSSGS